MTILKPAGKNDFPNCFVRLEILDKICEGHENDRRRILITVTQQNKETALDTDSHAKLILETLDSKKAEDILTIDLKGKSSLAERLVIATGTGQRHLSALAHYVITSLKQRKIIPLAVEGLEGSDWVVVDCGGTIVHLFTAEARARYELEKIWNVPTVSHKSDELL